jgi:hypothetical protein
MDIITFLILIGATFRLSSLLIADNNESEHGPYEILDRFRHWAGVRFDAHSRPYGTNEFAEMLCCIYCTSFWIGLVVGISYLIMPVYTTYFCLPLALSSGAIMVKRYAD